MRNLPIEIPDDEIQPWHSLGGIEHICELRKSCTVLYGIFTELARLVYHDTDGRLIGTPDVVWKANGTDIWIDSELRWEDQHPEVRPAIYIQLGQIQYQPFFPGFNAKVAPANRYGERHYEQKASGQVTFMHVASTVGEACALADNTDYALTLMQDPICHDFCFDQFISVGRVPLEKLQKEASEKYASGVTFSFDFSDAWDVREVAPVLKTIHVIHDVPEIPINGVAKDDNSSGHDTIDRANIIAEKKVSVQN